MDLVPSLATQTIIIGDSWCLQTSVIAQCTILLSGGIKQIQHTNFTCNNESKTRFVNEEPLCQYLETEEPLCQYLVTEEPLCLIPSLLDSNPASIIHPPVRYMHVTNYKKWKRANLVKYIKTYQDKVTILQ